ncbi:M28 family metallopeptidase [Persicobacter psychrovividus]|uniref:M28-family zinc peptidase n=1 Tax=Persicobacter psychrovividus TaxID=387638 RepID=A0ABM7VEW8_9BACT|nr:M28-family zinc peptidase [Persicobacter psychrovividus]
MKKICFAIALLFCGMTSHAQKKSAIDAQVTPNILKGQMNFFAADELQGRDLGSVGIDIAARYLSTTMQSFGVSPYKEGKDGYFQPVELQEFKVPKVQFAVEGLMGTSAITMNQKNLNFDGDALFLGYATPDEFKESLVKGKIILTFSGTKTDQSIGAAMKQYQILEAAAKKAGAKALVQIFRGAVTDWHKLDHYFNSPKMVVKGQVPRVRNDFTSIFVHENDQPFHGILGQYYKVQLKVDASGLHMVQDVPAKNIIGIVEGTDSKLKNEYVIYTAHYDHLGLGEKNAEGDSIYNGARDNGAGVLSVLNAAAYLAKHPTKRSAMFLFLTGEEKGLLGSQYYVENPVIPLKQCVYVMNNDNGACNDKSIITIVGLNRTTATPHFLKAGKTYGLKPMGDPTKEGLFRRSDNISFAEKGIPAPTLSLGFTGFDETVMHYYHQTDDNPATIDYDYLTKFVRTYIYAGALIGNDKKTPEWTVGDPYFKAGQKLYQP